MGVSIARKRTRLGRRVLRHQLAQGYVSSCNMTCFSCALVFRFSERARIFFIGLKRLSFFSYRLTVYTNDRFIGLTIIEEGHWYLQTVNVNRDC